ncbi:MAG: hypothetical protein SFW67_23430 [Myxococcaceae bacterium]|nr:hypothetical protein [Myxococcaceae bacterium]
MLTTLACSVCGAGQDGTEWAYLAMTGVVSLTPLAMIGGVAFWLYRASKRREQEEAERAALDGRVAPSTLR